MLRRLTSLCVRGGLINDPSGAEQATPAQRRDSPASPKPLADSPECSDPKALEKARQQDSKKIDLERKISWSPAIKNS